MTPWFLTVHSDLQWSYFFLWESWTYAKFCIVHLPLMDTTTYERYMSNWKAKSINYSAHDELLFSTHRMNFSTVYSNAITYPLTSHCYLFVRGFHPHVVCGPMSSGRNRGAGVQDASLLWITVWIQVRNIFPNPPHTWNRISGRDLSTRAKLNQSFDWKVAGSFLNFKTLRRLLDLSLDT